ncbi:MAG: DUF1028 domain-containing protein [Alphaproteobacteria bacterium]|nr:DUF1028 domain-containing protein [Alphaproteobacteria bacterium]
MTFSITARCPRTGMFGIAITTSSICVASRCVWARAQVGAIATQNITDPRIGSLGLDLMARGFGAKAALDQALAAGPYPEYRQVVVVDAWGGVAHHSGARTLGTNNVAVGESCAAAGNLLTSKAVPEAMVAGFLREPAEHLAERLLQGLEGGLNAGGEMGPVRSAGLYVVDRYPWPICDLRVDWHDAPVAELRRIWGMYQPQMPEYLTRAINPAAAPSYGVPGETR